MFKKTETTNNNNNNSDPENDFIQVINCEKVTEELVVSTIEKSREMISTVLHVPINTLILNYEIFTKHPFGGSLREREGLPFYRALLYVSQFIYLLNKIEEKGQNIKSFSDKIRSLIYDDWDNCANCIQLQHIMKAAFGIIANDAEFLDSSFQPKYISFLADTFLLQSTLCSCRFFDHILTAIGKVFVLIPVKLHPDRINAFRENERNSFYENDEHSTDFQAFLRLVGNISRLRKSKDDFAYKFHQDGIAFIHYATDFVSKPLFATFIDTLAALTKSKAIAEEFYKRLNESLSDIINLKHIVESFHGYASDFQSNAVNLGRLDYDDANSLEAILHLLSNFFKYSEMIRKDIIDDVDCRYSSNRDAFVTSLINLICSPIPASLKAAMFDTISSMMVDTDRAEDIWQKVEESQILTKEFVDSGEGGIISDIDIIESEARSFPLMRSFLTFLSSFLASNPSQSAFETNGQYFNVYHRFLMEQCLLKLQSRVFLHFHEKWSILSKICQVWTNLMCLYDLKDVSACIMQTSLCDSRFIDELIALINQEDIPEESLFCVFRLFLLIIDKESDFLKTMRPSDQIFYTPITRRLSWSSSSLIKLIQCVHSYDDDLKKIALLLAQRLASDSPEISQRVFARAQSSSIMSFKNVINKNDAEVEGGEENVRNTLLKVLISLGSSSHFVLYVCNFDMINPPVSLINSTLDKGILPVILRKMKETEAPKNYPLFAANSLKLLLMICDNHITSKPLLNFLRTNQSFFDEQLQMLQDSRCSKTAIGCFLQLVAREAMDSKENQCSNTTMQTFEILMESNGFRRQNQMRILLFQTFIDRIDNSEESECVAKGVFQTAEAFILSSSVVNRMKLNKVHWAKIWCELMNEILLCSRSLNNPTTLEYLTNSVGFIAKFIFDGEPLGQIPLEDRGKLLSNACHCLNSVNLNVYSRQSKIGVYTMISLMKKDDLTNVYKLHESNFISNLVKDIDGVSPTLKAAVYSVAESIIEISDVKLFQECFISKALKAIGGGENEDEVKEYIENPGASTMIAANFSFFNRLLILRNKDYQSFLIDSRIIQKIASVPFWNLINNSFSTSAQSMKSETILKISSKALHVIQALLIFAGNNEIVINDVVEFFDKYSKKQLLPVFNLPEILTLNALTFLIDLSKFLFFAPDEIAKRDDIMKILTKIKKRFLDNPEKIKDRIRDYGDKTYTKPDLSVLEEADVIIEKFQKFLS